MPPLVRRYIKTSFVFLVTGLLLGGYVSVGEFLLGSYPPRLFITAHVHLLLVGFMLMIVMGVATWMFPRPAKEDTRYRPELAEAVYWVTTAATVLRALAEIGTGLSGAAALRVLITLGGLGQLAGAALFVLNMWWRVRMPAMPPPPPANLPRPSYRTGRSLAPSASVVSEGHAARPLRLSGRRAPRAASGRAPRPGSSRGTPRRSAPPASQRRTPRRTPSPAPPKPPAGPRARREAARPAP